MFRSLLAACPKSHLNQLLIWKIGTYQTLSVLESLKNGGSREEGIEVDLQSQDASLKPDEKGASFFMHGCSSHAKIPAQFAWSNKMEEPSTCRSVWELICLTSSKPFENGLALHKFTMRLPRHQLFASLDLDPQELWAKAGEASCRYVDSHPDSGLRYEIQPASSTFFFANSQQSKCAAKLVVVYGTFSSLLRKVTSHSWYHFHRWETLGSNVNLPQRRLLCPVHILACEKGFENCYKHSSHSGFARCCGVRGPI